MNRALFLALLLAVVPPVIALPAPVSAEYVNGSFAANTTSKGEEGSFTLKAGTLFPQPTTIDRSWPDDKIVYVSTGVEMDFSILAGDIGGEFLTGKLRLTIFYLKDSPPGYEETVYYYLYGTYDFVLNCKDSHYTIHGPVVGDRYSLYLPGRITCDANISPDDDVFLMRINAGAILMDDLSITNGYFGSLRIMYGKPIKRRVKDNVVAHVINSPVGATITGLGLGTAVINQITPPDGSADFTLPADTTEVMARNGLKVAGNLSGAGANPLPGTFNFSNQGLRVHGGAKSGHALSMGRFDITPVAGGYTEGFLVGDSMFNGSQFTLDGFIFSLVSRGPVTGFLFGDYQLQAPLSGNWTGTIDAAIYDLDSAPPDMLTLDPELSDKKIYAMARDLNGWANLKSITAMINNNKRLNRIAVKYDVKKNKLYLYNKAVMAWVGGFAPGAAKTISTPFAALNCRKTTVRKFGEYVEINWAVSPKATMSGTWSIYGQAVDLSRQGDGWRRFGSTTIP